MTNDETASPRGSGPALSFSGGAGEIAPIVIKNVLLNIITLGFYRFWGRTNVRRYLWQHTNLFGAPLEYTGTGGELFKGFLLIFFVLLVPYFALYTVLVISGVLSELDPNPVFQFLTFVGILFLIGVATHRARRYRLSRTRWRGIRGAMSGSSIQYGLMTLGHSILTIVTLGWWIPMQSFRLWSVLTRQTLWGDKPFQFEGKVGPLYKRFAICWILVLPTMGLSMVWYKAREFSVLVSGMSYEGSEFQLDVDGFDLFKLMIGNFLIVLVTLGLGAPFTQLRVFRFMTEHVQIQGQPDFDAILQSQDQGPSVGEGLADAFDMGAV